MKKLLLLAIPALALSFALAPAPQTRVKPKEEADFPATLESAQQAWDAADYAACISHLSDAVTLASGKRAEAIRASLPAAPEGYEVEKPKNQDQANPMLAAMGMTIGNMVEHSYRKTGSHEQIRVTVTADSPMVTMLGMAFGNPAMMGEGAELIEYGAHRAVLKHENNGRKLSLQVLIHGKHVMDVSFPAEEELLFKMFDQAAIDKVATALGK